MDILTRNRVKGLAERSDGLCVSIYMPTHRAGQSIQQDPIRLKDLLSQAEERLIVEGLRAPEAQELLQPARVLLLNNSFWQHQSDGLALFLSSEGFRYYRLPFDFAAVVVVAYRFHIKPLLPLLSGDGRFYVLALSQSEIRLLQGTRDRVSEVNLESVPEGLVDVVRWDDPEKRFQFHTTTRTPGGERVRPGVGAERPAIFHGHGVASADDPKDYVSRYFHRIDEGVTEVLGDEQAPLVLAGVDYLLPIYREANAYPHLVDGGIVGNPEKLSAQELHEQAWAVVRPVFLVEREEAAARYSQLAGAGSERASDDLRQIVPAAYHRQVEVLFVALGLQRWGSFDPSANAVRLHEDAKSADEDLLDFAAVHTFLNGGTVYAVDPKEMPGDAPLAAVFRWSKS
jgi:hypothetical protein